MTAKRDRKREERQRGVDFALQVAVTNGYDPSKYTDAQIADVVVAHGSVSGTRDEIFECVRAWRAARVAR